VERRLERNLRWSDLTRSEFRKSSNYLNL
jgi:hypothetical protein